MNVLIACEESQTVCKAFRERGHRAFSCDIQDCSGGHPEWHIKGDVTPLLDGDCSFTTVDTHTHTQRGEWDLLIAHPPCTFLTNAGAVRMWRGGKLNEERYALAVEGREFFMRCLNAKCEHIAVENPVPMTVINLPRYDQIIEPYWFGEPYSKRTCLWLKNLPKLRPTNMLTEYQPLINGGGGRLVRQNYQLGQPFATSAKARSKTFHGIAEAMADQWTSTYQIQMRLKF